MSNDLKVHESQEFGTIRTVIIENKPYFCASDVAKALGYKRPNDAVSSHCRATVKYSTPISGKMQDINFIPEGDVYRLIVRSKLPAAEKFECWVFDEVLPSIRANGGYIYNQENMTPEQIVANALIVAQNIIAQKDKQIAQMQPKADFFDAVADSKTDISMLEAAKVLSIRNSTNNKVLGRNTVFEFLRKNKILDKRNVPYQRYVDAGYFRIIEQSYTVNGKVNVKPKTLVYQKGLDFIRKLALNNGYTI